jgi:hypothetical protein
MKFLSIASLAALLGTTMVAAAPLPGDDAPGPAVLGYKRSTDESSDLGYKREAGQEIVQAAVEGIPDAASEAAAEVLAKPMPKSKRHCGNPRK